MKILALVAGAVFLLLGIAGFAGMMAMTMMYSVVLAVAGLAFIAFAASRRRDLVTPRAAGRDLRDLSGI
jgi:uncharacterized RDD family membrane protein YckC